MPTLPIKAVQHRATSDTGIGDMLDRIWLGFAGLARFAAWIGGAMLLSAAFIVTAEILLRKVVSPVLGPEWNFTGSDEIAAYLFAVGTAWSLAHEVTTRANVRIDALYMNFGPRARAVMDLIALIVFMIFVAVLLERAWSLALQSYDSNIRSNTTLRVPLAWAQLPWVLGLSLFALSLVIAFLTTLSHLLRGDWARAAAISGAASTEDEVAAELSGLGFGKRGDTAANSNADRETR